MSSPSMPAPFFEVVVHDDDLIPPLCALCAGFEGGRWRAQECARHLCEWFPEFALTWEEYSNFGPHNAAELLSQAAKNIYSTEKYTRRGELGELLLHAIIRRTHDTVPAISKVFFKDSANDTVKGFDAVHVVIQDDSLELWLGEAKFYDDAADAIRAVIPEIRQHIAADYFRRECAAITNKLDNSWPHAARLKKLLHRNTPVDQIFDSLCIPVLLTYDSDVLKGRQKCSSACQAGIVDEATKHHSSFSRSLGTLPIVVHLFLVPLQHKQQLVTAFHERLKAWQQI